MRTTSSFSPGTFCASTQPAASRTTRSMKPCAAQLASKASDLAGTAMKSLSWRTMSLSH